MKWIGLLVLAAMGLSAASARETSPAPGLLIEGGTLVNVRRGEAIQNGAVLVQGERIIQVGARDTLQVPNDVQVIDARGKWILPGFIDMHVHLRDLDLLPLGLFLANGVTTVRDAGDSVLLVRLSELELSAGGRGGARLL